MDRSRFISAGFFLSKRVPRDNHGTPELLPETILSASGCICPFVPDTWAITWCNHSRSERASQALRFGLSEDSIDTLISRVTAIISDQSNYGYPNVCFSSEAAFALVQNALPVIPGLVLFELGLHQEDVDLFCKEAAPPPSAPGFAPVGENGVHSAIRRNTRLSGSGRLLGFEPVVVDASLSCSWLCNGLERDVASILGIRPNKQGFLPDLESARSAVSYISSPDVGAEPGLWLPWLFVEHPLEAVRRAT
jgi:hypothetical protein